MALSHSVRPGTAVEPLQGNHADIDAMGDAASPGAKSYQVCVCQ